MQRLAALAAVPIVAGSLMTGSVSAAAEDEVAPDAAIADSDSAEDTETAEDAETAEVAEEVKSNDSDQPDAEDSAPQDLESVEGEEEVPAPEELESLAGASATAAATGTNIGSGNLRCDEGYFYSIHRKGEVLQLQEQDGAWGSKPINRQSYSFRGSSDVENWNGLGVSKDGSTVYAFNRYRFTKSSTYGSVVDRVQMGRIVNGQRIVSSVYNLGTPSNLIAGAVAPDGTYYFGGYRFNKSSREFVLYKYSGGQIATVGIIPISTPVQDSTSAVNGDIAFDASGNMYLLFHEGGTTHVQLIPVLAEQLKGTGSTRQINPQPTTTIEVTPNNTASSQFNGVSFTADGYLMIEDGTVIGTKSTAYFYKVDSSTGDVVARATFDDDGSNNVYMDKDRRDSPWSYGGQVDLASCATFSTLKLKKTFPKGRAAKDDQVELQIWNNKKDTNKNKKLAWISTSGDEDGEQPEVAGPVIATPGEVFRLLEVPSVSEGTGSDRLRHYKSNLTCKEAGSEGALSENIETKSVNNEHPEMREWLVKIPSDSALQIQCMYENTPVEGQGTVTWKKTDAATDKILPDSTWKLTRLTDASGQKIAAEELVDGRDQFEIKDKTSKTEDATRDTNDATGEFKVEDLPYGKWRLEEVKAPDGYRIVGANKYEFTVNKDKKDVEAVTGGAIKNYKARIEWSKVDAADEKSALAGSEWKLTGPDGKELTVTDCVESECAPEVNDIDPGEGKFSVAELGNGEYTLKETKAPEGYLVAEKTYKIKITDGGYSVNGGVERKFPVPSETNYIPLSIGDIKNERMDGVVTWTKKDPSGKALHGSEWTIVKVTADHKPIDGAEAIQVTDCQANEESECTGPDTDPAGGAFEVGGLEFGEYKLVESKAPAGFVVDTTEHFFTISKNGEEVVAGAFENELGKGVKLPLTGGVGAFKFLIAGGILGVLAAAMGGAHVMRRRNS